MKKNFDKALGCIETLSTKEKQKLIEMIMQGMGTTNLDCCSALVEKYTKGNPDCPHCKAKAKLNVIKKGKKANGAQRYYCKQCGHFFVATTNTVFEGSRKNADVWKKFIELTIDCVSLKKCAAKCGISYQTAFTWRHKILNAFKVNQESTSMNGNVEVDEMLIPISYKGNHIKGQFTGRKRGKDVEMNMPRPAFYRGSDNRSSSSKDKACVFCMIENGNKSFYASVPGVGFMNNDMLDNTIGAHVNPNKATVIADSYKTTMNYLLNNNYKYEIRLSNISDNYNGHKPEIKDGLHIQHVNAMHRHIRRFLSNFCGVSSKYLDNYISLYVWLRNAKNRTTKKININDITISRTAVSDCYITRQQLNARPIVPCCA